MIRIPLSVAQKYVLDCQLLSTTQPLSGKSGVLTAIRHLGYVQIDTISVVERAHHHVLWTRVPDYRPEHLQTLAETDRAVFDCWGHAASFLPIESYPFTLIRKSTIDEGSGFWRRTDPKLAAHVLDRIRREGPLMSRDFAKERSEKSPPWMIPEVNQVIRQLFMTGQLMVAGRKGIQKTWDLAERVLPKSVSQKIPPLRRYAEHIVRRDLRAHGVIKTSEFGHLLNIPKTEIAAVLNKLKRAGEVIEVEIQGRSGTWFADGKCLESFSPAKRRTFQILSPFDNLVIQRKRMAELFGFDYTVECYVPAAKRKFGYFALPLLFGNKFVGVLDAKADRKSGVFRVQALHWTTPPTPEVRRKFDQRLKSFAQFCGCKKIDDRAARNR